MVSYGNDRRKAITLTVAAAASVSDSVEFRGLRPVAIITPATTDTNTAIIQFWAGHNGSTPVIMRDMGGLEVEAVMLATASWYIPLGNETGAVYGSDAFRGVNTMQIRLFQSDGSTAQTQTAIELFTLVCEEM